MYPFLQIDGDTEIVHSNLLPNGEVKVYIEKPDARDGFHHATCFFAAVSVGKYLRLYGPGDKSVPRSS